MTAIAHPLEVLSREQLDIIHENVLRVLDEIGLYLPNQEILELFEAHGAKVDFPNQIVRIPPGLVTDCIAKFPPGYTWLARNPANSVPLFAQGTYFSFPDSAIRIMDLDSNRRDGTRKDGEAICRLCDALPNMAVASTGVNPPDLPSDVLEAWLMHTMYHQTSKPVYGMCRSEKISNMTLEMAEIVAGTCDHLKPGELPLAIITNPVSPLFNTPNQLEGMMVYLHKGLPISISPEVQAGATGPVTLAGSLVQQTAEFMGHAVIAQLVHPGTPVMYGTVSSIFDMKKMMLPYGAPEADLLAIATVQMARYYNIPGRTTGGSSDSNELDVQAGVDALMSTLVPILAGASFVLHGAGEYENTLAVSYEKLLIDEEIISMAQRFAQGIVVNEDTLGFDVIKEVGPRGHFLATNHTVRHFRKEHFMPKLLTRDTYEAWVSTGRKTAIQRAREKAHELLNKHQPQPLPIEASRELTAIYHSVLKTAGMN